MSQRSIINFTRAALVTMFLGAISLQILIPLVAFETGGLYPEVRHLVVPYSCAGVLSVLCGQVGLVAVWMLIAAMARGSLFATSALHWVDVLRWSVVPAAAIPAAVGLHLLAVVGLGGPGVLIGTAAAVAIGASAFIMLTLGRRLYLAQAAEHAELEGVI